MKSIFINMKKGDSIMDNYIGNWFDHFFAWGIVALVKKVLDNLDWPMPI